MSRKSYVQIKTDEGYKLVEKHNRYKYSDNKSAAVFDDIKPMVSPVDGSVISSRSQYREHMKKHNVVNIGNEQLKPNMKKPYRSDDSLKRELYHLWENLPQNGPR